MKPYYQDSHVTIYHKDCRDMSEVGGSKIDLVLTDPPYVGQDPSWFQECRGLDCDRLVFTPGIDNIALYPQPKWVLCWYKPGGPRFSRVGGFNQWEPVFVYGNGFMFKQDYFYQVPLNFGRGPETHHIHPKPESLWSWLISSASKRGDLILDPFLGSGTTAYCAKKLNRRCIGYEIEEKYCEIAANRCRQTVMEL